MCTKCVYQKETHDYEGRLSPFCDDSHTYTHAHDVVADVALSSTRLSGRSVRRVREKEAVKDFSVRGEQKKKKYAPKKKDRKRLAAEKGRPHTHTNTHVDREVGAWTLRYRVVGGSEKDDEKLYARPVLCGPPCECEVVRFRVPGVCLAGLLRWEQRDVRADKICLATV